MPGHWISIKYRFKELRAGYFLICSSVNAGGVRGSLGRNNIRDVERGKYRRSSVTISNSKLQ